jgi:hypothetical protein
MARDKIIKVYDFSELSDAAKERAKQDHAEACGYPFSTEAMDSIKALAAYFGGSVRDYSVDWFNSSHSSMTFDMPEMEEGEIADLLSRLGTYDEETGKGNGDCKLTGYTADEDAIDGFRLAWRNGERDLSTLMEEAFDSWLKAAQDDCEHIYKDEAFAETCEANSYEFYANGQLA